MLNGCSDSEVHVNCFISLSKVQGGLVFITNSLQEVQYYTILKYIKEGGAKQMCYRYIR